MMGIPLTVLSCFSAATSAACESPDAADADAAEDDAADDADEDAMERSSEAPLDAAERRDPAAPKIREYL